MYRWSVRLRAKMDPLFARLVIAPIEEHHILAEQRRALPAKEAVGWAVGGEGESYRRVGRRPRERWRLCSALDDDQCPSVRRRLFRGGHDSRDSDRVCQPDPVTQLMTGVPSNAAEDGLIELVVE